MEDESKTGKDQKITARILTNSEVDISYWFEYPTEEFIELLVHDIRHELNYFHTIVDMVHNDTESDKVSLESFKNEYTIKDICILLLQCEAKLEVAVNVADEYGRHLRSKDVT